MELVKMYTKSGHILVLDVFALVKNAMLVMTFPCLRLLTGKRLERFSEKKTLIVFYTSNAKKPK